MSSRSTIAGLGLLLLAAVLFAFAGCSSDKTTTSSTGRIGSPSDPEFLLVKQQVDSYLDSTQEVFSVGLDNVYQLPTDTEEVRNMYSPMGPDDTALYSYTDGWHVTYVSRSNAYFSDFFRDSVQFQINSVPVEEPTDLDYLHFIRHWSYTSNQTDVTHVDMSGDINLEFENLDTEIATISGSNNARVEWSFISPDSTIEAIFELNVVVTDVTVNQIPLYGWVSGCPCSGGLTIDLDNSYVVDYGDNTDFWVRRWNVDIEFDNGVAGVRISSENEVWTYTRPLCTPSGS